MSLFVYVMDPDLRWRFKEHLKTRRWTDSGFDLLNPAMTLDFTNFYYGVEMKLGVKCAALTEDMRPAPYLLLARSSTSMTPLRMSNQIGLADMGYRGELIARVDNVSITDKIEIIGEGRRLFQIVQHNWMPWKAIHIVDSEDELPPAPDNRAGGGFGSTGN
jgi:dUTP pyrophosphatase